MNVELTAADLERIPRGNLRVPRDEFAAVWQMAERMAHDDWYAAGVVKTCRWVACTSIVFNYPHGPKVQPATAPVTSTRRRAHEELIETECAAADRWLARHPDGIADQPGWLEGVVATLEWVWRGSGRPPLDVRQADAG